MILFFLTFFYYTYYILFFTLDHVPTFLGTHVRILRTGSYASANSNLKMVLDGHFQCLQRLLLPAPFGKEFQYVFVRAIKLCWYLFVLALVLALT